MLAAKFAQIEQESGASAESKSEHLRAPEDFPSRLRRWRENTHLDAKQAAAALGIGVGRYREIEDGRAPSSTVARKFDAMQDASPRMMEGVLGWRAEKRRDAELESNGVKANAGQGSHAMVLRKVPIIGWAKAGEAMHFEDIVDWENAVTVPTNDPKAFAISVKGDSMSPLIGEGDYVVVSPSSEPANEKYVVAHLRSQGMVCKQLRKLSAVRFEFRSLNPFYAPFECGVEDIVWMYPIAHLIKKL